MEQKLLVHRIDELELELNKGYEEYLSWNRELKPFTERQLEPEEIEKANVILSNLQSKFEEIYPAFHWITVRYDHAKKVIDAYKNFIEDLKKNGARMHEEPLEEGFEPSEDIKADTLENA